jgi:5-methylcytosine-specific restriction protein B
MRRRPELIVGGTRYSSSRQQFEERLAREEPEIIRTYGVEVGGRRFPIKQAVATGLDIPRASFQSQEAFRVLRQLGFTPFVEE